MKFYIGIGKLNLAMFSTNAIPNQKEIEMPDWRPMKLKVLSKGFKMVLDFDLFLGSGPKGADDLCFHT